MFDALSYPDTIPPGTLDARQDDDFARECREPAERWSLERRANRPAAMRLNLPRVATC